MIIIIIIMYARMEIFGNKIFTYLLNMDNNILL